MTSPPFTGFPFPPPPPTPASPSQNSTTVIVVVFISFGCLFLVGALCFACWFFHIKKKKQHKKETKRVQKAEDIDIDEHLKVHEMVVPGRHGRRIEELSVEDDINIHERIRKDERDRVEKGMRGANAKDTASGIDLEQGASSSSHQNYINH